MPRVHFLNVGRGDCSVIEHASGHVTMIDICGGNLDPASLERATLLRSLFSESSKQAGDFWMRHYRTNPISYLKKHQIAVPFRFILTHPDMDHLDGFSNLLTEVGITNFWDNGLFKEKPSFESGHFQEKDWDAYQSVKKGAHQGITVVTPLAGSKFDFANKGSETGNGDCLSIVAPSPELVTAANESEDPNDGSYVIVYRSSGGNIVFGGDAHDETWDYVIANHRALVENCSILIAPHHGRDSDRQYDFLDVLKPRLTLFGTADSEHLSYGAYHHRALKIITNNQAGNVVLVPKKNYIEVFLENRRFAETFPTSDLNKTECGAYFARNVPRHQPSLQT